MEDEFRVRIDMGTTIRQRRNLLRSFNELASMFQSGPVMEADLQMVKASRIASFLIRRKYWKHSLSSKYDRPSVPYPYYPLYLAVEARKNIYRRGKNRGEIRTK